MIGNGIDDDVTPGFRAAAEGGQEALSRIRGMKEIVEQQAGIIGAIVLERMDQASSIHHSSEAAGQSAGHAQRVLGASSQPDTAQVGARINKLADDASTTAQQVGDTDRLERLQDTLSHAAEELGTLIREIYNSNEHVSDHVVDSQDLAEQTRRSTDHM